MVTVVLNSLSARIYKSYLRLARAAPERDWRRHRLRLRHGGVYLSINSLSRKLTAMDAMKEIHFPLVWLPVERMDGAFPRRCCTASQRVSCSCSDVYDASMPNHRAVPVQTRNIYLRHSRVFDLIRDGFDFRLQLPSPFLFPPPFHNFCELPNTPHQATALHNVKLLFSHPHLPVLYLVYIFKFLIWRKSQERRVLAGENEIVKADLHLSDKKCYIVSVSSF